MLLTPVLATSQSQTNTWLLIHDKCEQWITVLRPVAHRDLNTLACNTQQDSTYHLRFILKDTNRIPELNTELISAKGSNNPPPSHPVPLHAVTSVSTLLFVAFLHVQFRGSQHQTHLHGAEWSPVVPDSP
jgi:hypothetical protein